MRKRLTAGELSLKAASDSTSYNSMDVGIHLTEDIGEQIQICIDNHRNIIDEDEFCIVMVLADDPLIKGVMRRKFYAWPYLPKPRPRQSCFIYSKRKDEVKRLWVLPEAFCMAALSTMTFVAPQWRTMKEWSDAFFAGKFWEYIRKEHSIDLLSESEYLDAHSEELLKAGCKHISSPISDPFDFSKISIDKIVDTNTSLTD